MASKVSLADHFRFFVVLTGNKELRPIANVNQSRSLLSCNRKQER